MTLNDARSVVAKLNSRLLTAGIAVAVNPAVAVQHGDRTRLSWPSSKAEPGMFTDEAFASLAEYRRFLLGNHFTCLLRDGSLIQVSHDFKNNAMVAHRYCFYPCPLQLPEARYATDVDAWTNLLEYELFSEIEALTPSDQDDDMPAPVMGGLLRLRSPIRFDYDPEKQTPTEPASHLHLCDPGVRIPVYAAVPLPQFLQFVITYFYPAHLALLDDFPIEHFARCIEPLEETRLHFDCRREL